MSYGPLFVVTILFLLHSGRCFLTREEAFTRNIVNSTHHEGHMDFYFEDVPRPQLQPINNGQAPDYFDWRDQKMVSPVKNQGECAACWAFSTVANIESHVKIYLNKEVVLSEQFLLDCDTSNDGCASASILNTFSNIVSKFGGVLSNSNYYEYIARRVACRWNGNKPLPVPVVGYRRVYPDEKMMMEAVFKHGPLSAAINSASMVKYGASNFIDEPTEEQCPSDPKYMNHAVLIVGYNIYQEKNGRTIPYWIIKNSWSTKWGDQGYYYLVRGKNACGITNDVSFAYVE